MNNLPRYIKTKVDNKDMMLCMYNCNLCPMLKFVSSEKTAWCSIYSKRYSNLDFISSSIVETNIHSYSFYRGISTPLQKIPIPHWCDLPFTYTIGINHPFMYTKIGENKYKKENYDNTNINVIAEGDVKYGIDVISLSSNSKKTPDRRYSSIDNLPYYSKKIYEEPKEEPKVQINKCSCCGNLKENVNRKNNIGMCDDCYNNNVNNEDLKYFSFINNFRLKRNKNWIEKIEKKIDKVV